MIPKIGRRLHNTDLEMSGAHVVVPEKQCIETLGINLRDAGEIQNDVGIARFLGCQYQDLDACRRPTTKLSSECEDFCVVVVLFMYLKHRTYLLVWRKSVILPQ